MDVKNLVEKIRLAQEGNESVMLELIGMRTPLINKFTRLLNYDEDCRSELILKLISLVKREINLDKINEVNDGAIIQYIRIAMTHFYIALSKAKAKARDREISYDEFAVDLLEKDFVETFDTTDNLFAALLRSVLTEREFLCVKLIVLNGWTAQAVSAKLGVSKQAVNQCKNRALKKLKDKKDKMERLK